MWPPQFRVIPCLRRMEVDVAREAAEAINLPHEDYPLRVPATHEAIIRLARTIVPSQSITQYRILQAHRRAFSHMPYAGKYRTCNVRVGAHVAPPWEQVAGLAAAMHPWREVGCPGDLQRWYVAFEELHPFQDGNGRAGGVILAAYHHVNFGGYMVSGV